MSVNKVTLLGRICSDIETHNFQNGTIAVKFSLATGEKWTDKQTGEIKESTEFHTIKAFNKLAEILSKYAVKGQRIYIEGKLKTEKWTDKDGVKRYSTVVEMNYGSVLDLLDKPKNAQQNQNESADFNQEAVPDEQPEGDLPF